METVKTVVGMNAPRVGAGSVFAAQVITRTPVPGVLLNVTIIGILLAGTMWIGYMTSINEPAR